MPNRITSFLKKVTGKEKETPAKKTLKKTPAKKSATKKAVKKTVKKTLNKTPAKKPQKIEPKKASSKTVKKAPAKRKRGPETPKKLGINWAKTQLEPVTYAIKTQWLAEHSKIKAAIENGLTESYLNVARLLYIGAAHGYTIHHISHKPLELYAIEKSPDMMRHFLPIAANLPTVVPILHDAAYPDAYAHIVPEVDVLFQDIAQKDQVGIFLANCERFLSPQGVGMLVIKAQSIDAHAEPAAVFAEAKQRLEESGATIVQELSLEPFQKHHRIFVIHLNPYDW